MRIPLLAGLALALMVALPTRAATNPEIVDLGHDTYALTRWADNGFTRNTDKLKAQALEDAAAFCARQHKELKVVNTTTKRPLAPMLGFAQAKVVFQALEPGSPELAPASAAPTVTAPAAPATPTDTLYSDLMKLDDLRKRGILTEEEFQAQKKRVLEQSK